MFAWVIAVDYWLKFGCALGCATEIPASMSIHSTTTSPHSTLPPPPALGAFGELPRLPVDIVVGAGVPVGVANVSQQVKTMVEEARKQLEKTQAY